MATDIVERLRERATYDDLAILTEAANEIERLRAWNYRILQRADAAQTEVEGLRAGKDQLIAISAGEIAKRNGEIERLRALLKEHRKKRHAVSGSDAAEDDDL